MKREKQKLNHSYKGSIQQIIVLSILMTLAGQLVAQSTDDSNFRADFGTDLVSRYVWRGKSLCNAASIQPYAEIGFKNIALGSWGSYSLDQQEMQEVDLYLAYSTAYLTFTINDYFNPTDNYGYHGYFDLNRNTTLHTVEAMVDVADLPHVPLTLSAAVMFLGNDLDDNGNNLFSGYVEIGYPFSINETDLNLFLGMTPANGYYYDKPAFVNAGISMSKELYVTDSFSLPISGSFIVNPAEGNVFLVFGISL